MNHHSSQQKHINSSKMVDAEEKANGHNAGYQEQKKQLTSNERMIDYCQFTMQSLMECYEIVGGLYKKQLHYKNVKSQDALTISPNLAQNSALVELKGFKLLQKML